MKLIFTAVQDGLKVSYLLAVGKQQLELVQEDVIPLVVELQKEECCRPLSYLKKSHPRCSVGLGKVHIF